MKLSIVIPCYNAADTIELQLEALARQHWSQSWEVIVADNGSTDGSTGIIESYRMRLSNLRIVDASRRPGQPYALNVATQAATGESVAFCDADDEVGSGWLQAMGKALSSYDFVACRMGTVKLNPVWVCESRGNPQRDGLQMIWYPPYLPHAGGGTIGVKKELVELIGGFDESLPILHDTDFCFRLQLAGTKLHFVPDAVTHIRYRGTAWSNYRQSRNFAEYNVLLSKRYRSSDVKMSSQLWRRYLYDWKRLLLNSPTIRGKAGRFAWMWLFGRQVGRLQGSIKHQTPPV